MAKPHSLFYVGSQQPPTREGEGVRMTDTERVRRWLYDPAVDPRLCDACQGSGEHREDESREPGLCPSCDGFGELS